MATNAACTIYIGNLDPRVTDRVLYDIIIQAGRVVDLYIPRDKETDKPKGYAFAEYETEEIADYAVRLFSGLVTLYQRTLKFAISGQDKQSQNSATAITHASNASHKRRPHPESIENMENSRYSTNLSQPSRVSAYPVNYSQVPVPASVGHQSNGYGSSYNSTNYNYTARVFGSTLDNITRSRSGHYDMNSTIVYPSY